MIQRPDDKQREPALTDLDSTLLVEASAGTGKTALLAGRVAMLLAAGHTPSSIAAITFTERAAAELRARVDKFASMLVNRTVPKDLEPAFRHRHLSDTQAETLSSARTSLGELTTSTIHSFCLTILQSYTVEARIDPGAAVMDAEQTDLAFQSIFDSWLNERLGQGARPDDPIVVMAVHDPNLAVKTLKSLAKFRRSYPEARPLPPPRYADTVHDLIDAVADFRRWISRIPAPDEAMNDVAALEELANVFAPATSGALDFSQLWLLVHPKSGRLLPRGGHIVSQYKGRINLWSRSAGKVDGPQLSSVGKEHYERCAKLFADTIGAIADTLLASFFGETDQLVDVTGLELMQYVYTMLPQRAPGQKPEVGKVGSQDGDIIIGAAGTGPPKPAQQGATKTSAQYPLSNPAKVVDDGSGRRSRAHDRGGSF